MQKKVRTKQNRIGGCPSFSLNNSVCRRNCLNEGFSDDQCTNACSCKSGCFARCVNTVTFPNFRTCLSTCCANCETAELSRARRRARSRSKFI